MGAKESQLKESPPRGYQTSNKTHRGALRTNQRAGNNREAMRHPKSVSTPKGCQASVQMSRRPPAGDLGSENSNCGADIRVGGRCFGDEASMAVPDTKESVSVESKMSTASSNEGLSFLRPFQKNESDGDGSDVSDSESDNSSSVSLGADDFLQKLKNKRSTNTTRPKTSPTCAREGTLTPPWDEEVEANKPGCQKLAPPPPPPPSNTSCSSQMSLSSSSPASCCTPEPVVDFAKLKKAGAAKLRLQQQLQETTQIREVTSLPTLQIIPPQQTITKSASSNLVYESGIGNPECTTVEGILAKMSLGGKGSEGESKASRPGDWVTPQPSPKIGYSLMDDGEVIFTAFLQLKGRGVDEYESTKKRSERSLRGLQCQHNCRIKLYDTTTERRTRLVHKMRIRGPGFREVVRCKNSLPRCISDLLITAHANSDEQSFMAKGRR